MIYDTSQTGKHVRTQAPKPTICMLNSISQTGNSKGTEKNMVSKKQDVHELSKPHLFFSLKRFLFFKLLQELEKKFL